MAVRVGHGLGQRRGVSSGSQRRGRGVYFWGRLVTARDRAPKARALVDSYLRNAAPVAHRVRNQVQLPLPEDNWWHGSLQPGSSAFSWRRRRWAELGPAWHPILTPGANGRVRRTAGPSHLKVRSLVRARENPRSNGAGHRPRPRSADGGFADLTASPYRLKTRHLGVRTSPGPLGVSSLLKSARRSPRCSPRHLRRDARSPHHRGRHPLARPRRRLAHSGAIRTVSSCKHLVKP